MELNYTEKCKQTKHQYATIQQLRQAVLQEQYHPQQPYFSRSFLWKSLALNSYTNSSFQQVEFLSSRPTMYDPLTNDEELDVIKVDVDRLLLDPIFAREEIKNDMMDILYTFSKQVASYRQGFHELCGVVYLNLYRDGAAASRDLRTDCYHIFSHLVAQHVIPTYYNQDAFLGWCVSIFNKYLLLIDPSLYELLIKYHNIDSQIWLIRWCRLLFLRELGLQNTEALLDFLWCYDADLTKLVPFLIIILLVRVKMSLVECEDQGELLYLLLHYPFHQYTRQEIQEMVQFATQMYQSPESELKAWGVKCNQRYHSKVNWNKVKDLGKLRLELKLQRRVRGALKK